MPGRSLLRSACLHYAIAVRCRGQRPRTLHLATQSDNVLSDPTGEPRRQRPVLETFAAKGIAENDRFADQVRDCEIGSALHVVDLTPYGAPLPDQQQRPNLDQLILADGGRTAQRQRVTAIVRLPARCGGPNDPLRRKALRAQTAAPLGPEGHRCPPPSEISRPPLLISGHRCAPPPRTPWRTRVDPRTLAASHALRPCETRVTAAAGRWNRGEHTPRRLVEELVGKRAFCAIRSRRARGLRHRHPLQGL